MTISSPPAQAVSALQTAQPAHAHRSFPQELLRRLFITRGVRFEAKARLEKKHQVSTLAIAMLSLSVIAAELLSLLVKTKTPAMELVFPIATIIAPIFIIILADHEASKQYLVHAERMHRSAQRVQELLSELELLLHLDAADDAVIKRILGDYEAVLRDYSTNHDNVDYFFFQALHPARFTERDKSWKRRANIQIRGRVPYYLNIWGIPAVIVCGPVILLFIAVVSLVSAPHP